MNNTKRKKLTRQEWKQKTCYPIDDIIQDCEKFFTNTSQSYREILNLFFYYDEKFVEIFPTQVTIAKKVGKSREWTNKLVNRMEREGILVKKYRHMHASYYKLSPWFRNPYVISKLRHIFSALKAPLMLSMLLSLSMQCSPIFTHTNILKCSNYNQRDYGWYVARAQAWKNTQKKELTKKYTEILEGRWRMEHTFSQVLSNIRSLKLTQWGKIALSPFCDAALQWADYQCMMQKPKKDQFRYFLKLCCIYSQKHSIKPDWMFARTLADYFKMPDKPDFIILEDTQKGTTASKKTPESLSYQHSLQQTRYRLKNNLDTTMQNADEKTHSAASFFRKILRLE